MGEIKINDVDEIIVNLSNVDEIIVNLSEFINLILEYKPISIYISNITDRFIFHHMTYLNDRKRYIKYVTPRNNIILSSVPKYEIKYNYKDFLYEINYVLRKDKILKLKSKW